MGSKGDDDGVKLLPSIAPPVTVLDAMASHGVMNSRPRERKNYYSDLDLAMTVHPLTGDLIPKRNVEAVRRSIRYIFGLDAGDVPFKPEVHAGIKALLFEPVGSTTAVIIEKRLEWLVKRMEPRVTLKNIQVAPSADGTGYNISVWFSIKSIMVDDNYSFFVQRVR